MEQLGILAKDPLFAKKVSMGVACPDGKEAKEVLQMFKNVLKNSGAGVAYSPFESASAVSKVHAMCQWYGSPSQIVQILNSPVQQRMRRSFFAHWHKALRYSEITYQFKMPI